MKKVKKRCKERGCVNYKIFKTEWCTYHTSVRYSGWLHHGQVDRGRRNNPVNIDSIDREMV